MDTIVPRFAKLHHALTSFFRRPRDPSGRDVRFGHLALPHNHISRFNISTEMIASIRRTLGGSGIAFVLSPLEVKLISRDVEDVGENVAPFDQKVMDYSECLDVLQSNRAAPGQGPEAWRAGPQPQSWNLDGVLPNQMIVVISIDLSLPADCCLALIGLIQWALDVSHRSRAKVRLLTISTCLNNNLLSTLVRLREDHPVAHFDFDSGDLVFPSPNRPTVALPMAIPSEIHRVMLSAGRGSKHAVVYAPGSDHARAFGALNQFSPGSALFSSLSQREHFASADSIMDRIHCHATVGDHEPRVEVIEVDPDFPIPQWLDGFTHAHIVLGDEWKGTFFDAMSRQLVFARYELTADERQAMQWWCEQPNIPDGNVHIYSGTNDLDSYLDARPSRRRVQVENTQAGGFMAAVFDMASWGLDPVRVLSCFVHSPLVLQEMRSRLSQQGIIQAAPCQLGFQGRQATVFRAVLPRTQYDHRLAHFVALPSSNPRVLSIKLQIAAVLIVLQSHNIEIHDHALAHTLRICWGHGRALAPTGFLWTMLGLWKRLAAENDEFENGEDFQFHPNVRFTTAQGGIAATTMAARIFRHILEQLKDVFTLHQLPEVYIAEETGDLTRAQLTEVQRHLLQAFCHQLVLTRRVNDAWLEHTVVATGAKLVGVT
ncbi:hypothetical protein ACHAPT_013609 [Fusarium lateritium]